MSISKARTDLIMKAVVDMNGDWKTVIQNSAFQGNGNGGCIFSDADGYWATISTWQKLCSGDRANYGALIPICTIAEFEEAATKWRDGLKTPITVPLGTELYVSTIFGVQMWFKMSEGVILECKAPKTPSTPQYPFWEVSTYPSLKVLEDSFGSALHAIHELGVEGDDWVEMGR